MEQGAFDIFQSIKNYLYMGDYAKCLEELSTMDINEDDMSQIIKKNFYTFISLLESQKDEEINTLLGELKTKTEKQIIPITIKSRQGFFYDDDMKKKKYTVSMQKYHPQYHLVENTRYSGAGIGIGERLSFSKNRNPGPADYYIPGNFDRGLRGKLALN